MIWNPNSPFNPQNDLRSKLEARKEMMRVWFESLIADAKTEEEWLGY